MNIKLVHVLNSTDGDREKKSIESLSSLTKVGVNYIQQVTPLYTDDVPVESAFYQSYSKPHYGLYKSYTKAMKENFTDDIDALIVCECDSVINITPDEFTKEINKTLSFCDKYGIFHFSWGGNTIDGVRQSDIKVFDKEYPNYIIVGKIILAHFNIFTKMSRDLYLRMIDETGWETADVWLNLVYHVHTNQPQPRQATTIKPIAYQTDGISYLDDVYKSPYYNNTKFRIRVNKDKNTVYIRCNSSIDTTISIYTLTEDMFVKIYTTNTNFNNNEFFYKPNTKFNNAVFVEVKHDGKIIKEHVESI